jgi:hypothetical protein
MSQWMQCNWIQQTPTWADSVCSIHPDTHDGFDEDIRKRVKDEAKAFKSARERLREVITQAWDGPQEAPVAAEMRALAAPHVERMESGALRIDYEALQRHRTELLAFEDQLRAEFAARMAAYEADEEEAVLLLIWS